MVCATNQWIYPTKINLVSVESPQAITSVVGCASGVSTNDGEAYQTAIRRREVAALPVSLLSAHGYIGADKND
jgi:hypothetical protein